MGSYFFQRRQIYNLLLRYTSIPNLLSQTTPTTFTKFMPTCLFNGSLPRSGPLSLSLSLSFRRLIFLAACRSFLSPTPPQPSSKSPTTTAAATTSRTRNNYCFNFNGFFLLQPSLASSVHFQRNLLTRITSIDVVLF